jgi:hypothetical protein
MAYSKDNDTKSTDANSLFKGQESHLQILFLVKKAEKLSFASYKVTEHLKDKEELKWKIRSHSLAVLEGLSRTVLGLPHVLLGTLEEVRRDLFTLTRLFGVASSLGTMSPMNAGILAEEYRQIDIKCSVFFTQLSPRLSRSEEVSIPLAVSEAETILLAKEHGLMDYKGQKETISSVPPTIKDNVSYLSDKKTSYKRQEKININKELAGSDLNKLEVKTNRQDLILSFIKKTGREVSIKDIVQAPSIAPFYGEKTIQRELVDLVERGVLRKKGERRWSRYFL